MNSLEFARLIAVWSYNSGVKAVNGEGGIAASFGLPPIKVINALYAGERLEVFGLVRKKGGIEKVLVSDEQYEHIAKNTNQFGDQFADLAMDIEELVLNYNAREDDVVRDQVMLWTGGLPPAIFDTVIDVLRESGKIATYDIADPKDKKSVYTFLTKPENAEHRWGLKQLKK